MSEDKDLTTTEENALDLSHLVDNNAQFQLNSSIQGYSYEEIQDLLPDSDLGLENIPLEECVGRKMYINTVKPLRSTMEGSEFFIVMLFSFDGGKSTHLTSTSSKLIMGHVIEASLVAKGGIVITPKMATSGSGREYFYL